MMRTDHISRSTETFETLCARLRAAQRAARGGLSEEEYWQARIAKAREAPRRPPVDYAALRATLRTPPPARDTDDDDDAEPVRKRGPSIATCIKNARKAGDTGPVTVTVTSAKGRTVTVTSEQDPAKPATNP